MQAVVYEHNPFLVALSGPIHITPLSLDVVRCNFSPKVPAMVALDVGWLSAVEETSWADRKIWANARRSLALVEMSFHKAKSSKVLAVTFHRKRAISQQNAINLYQTAVTFWHKAVTPRKRQ